MNTNPQWVVTRREKKKLFNLRDDALYKFTKCLKGKGHPQQVEVAQWVPGTLRPLDFLDVQHYKGGRSSALLTGRLHPRINPWYSFLEAESTEGHTVLSVATEKITKDNTGNGS